jgi:hypothetical protein
VARHDEKRGATGAAPKAGQNLKKQAITSPGKACRNAPANNAQKDHGEYRAGENLKSKHFYLIHSLM